MQRRKILLAQSELLQIGQLSKITEFGKVWGAIPKNKKRFIDEKKRILNSDRHVNKERESMPQQQRWKTELHDAFDAIAIFSCPSFLLSPYKLIGKFGFQKLLLYGKLLNMSVTKVDEAFRSLDPSGSNFITFSICWQWFNIQAQRRDAIASRNNSKPFTFTVADLISAEERALIKTLAIYCQEQDEMNAELLRLEEERQKMLARSKRMRGKGLLGDSDDSSSENSEEEVDDESSFDNLDALKGIDIGKLMRYLTRPKPEEVEKEKSEDDEDNDALVEQVQEKHEEEFDMGSIGSLDSSEMGNEFVFN